MYQVRAATGLKIALLPSFFWHVPNEYAPVFVRDTRLGPEGTYDLSFTHINTEAFRLNPFFHAQNVFRSVYIDSDTSSSRIVSKCYLQHRREYRLERTLKGFIQFKWLALVIFVQAWRQRANISRHNTNAVHLGKHHS